ncbi:hypothetical protein AX17_006790, partial [Amanita inopinata Kibby_2008]
TKTIVLKKLGKPDYSKPNAWRPVVLSDGFMRVFNKCIANTLLDKLEEHNMLSHSHYRGWKGRSTMDAIL